MCVMISDDIRRCFGMGVFFYIGQEVDTGQVSLHFAPLLIANAYDQV